MADDEKTSILVVDDMPDKLRAIQVVLEDLQLEVVCVSSGREALRAILQRDFAVVLLDVNMPEMDGFETASLIRTRKRSEHLPIIFLTAYDDEQRRWQSYSLGAVDFIPTPVIPAVLRAKVAVFVDLFRKTEQVKRQAEQEVALVREQAARAAAEQANRGSTFLADASNQLSMSLDYEATIATLLKIPIPFLCDATLLVLRDSYCDEYIDFGEFGEDSGGLTIWKQNRIDSDDVAPDLLAVIEATFVGSTRVGLFDGRLFNADNDEANCPRHTTLVPMVARGRTFGVLGLVCNNAPCETREHGTHDVEHILAQELSNRGGIAIDNARLHREIYDGNRRKDEFLAMLGHELRNPLGAISNAVAVMSLTMQSGLDANESIEIQSILERQVRQMNRLIEDLLDVARITRGKIRLRKEVVDSRVILRRAMTTCQPAIDDRGHTLFAVLAEEPLMIFADAARIEQIVTNLLTNAIKYSPPGASIFVDAELVEGNVVIRIRDTGLGISRELLYKVFDLFVQGERSLDRSQGGLGIGLTLVKSLVEMHGGVVTVASEGHQKGSVFTVSLPSVSLPHESQSVADKTLNEPNLRGNDILPAKGAQRMLVIEDNLDIATTFKQMLSTGGHDVQLAHDGASGLEVAIKTLPDVIFIDIGLPAMDGYAVANQLRGMDIFSNTVLVAMTGYGQPDDRRRSKDAGFHYHLIKPVPMEELDQLLREIGSAIPATLEQEASD
jgi:signal transduction histidine kinase/DNA-binding response OmpR family regulator